ncbi:MAG: hypothetical protein AAF605_09110 [Myxococcota bacterium]
MPYSRHATFAFFVLAVAGCEPGQISNWAEAREALQSQSALTIDGGITLEAEAAPLLLSPMVTREIEGASGGSTITSPQENSGLAFYKLTTTGGRFDIALRGYSDSAGSVGLQLDEGTILDMAFSAGEWQTVVAEDIELSQGDHLLALRGQSADLAIDSIEWTTHRTEIPFPLEVRLIREDTQAVLDSNLDDGIEPLTAQDFAGKLGFAAFPMDDEDNVVRPVTLELAGPVSATKSEFAAPFALFDDDRTNVYGSDLVPGDYTLRVRTGEHDRSWNFTLRLPDDEPGDDPAIDFPLDVHLISGATQERLDTDLSDGVPPLPASEFASLGFAAFPKGNEADVERPVTLELTGPVSATKSEFAAPYALFNDDGTNVFGIPFKEGSYTLRVTTGAAEVSYTFTLSVVSGTDPGENPDDDPDNDDITPPPALGLYEHPMSANAQDSDLAGWNVPADLGGFDYEIVRVTNLNDAGTGSLRDAIERSDIDENTTWRVVVFDVAGRIDFQNSNLNVVRNKTIIAGQTAPGHVELWNTTLRVVNVSDVLIMHVAIRRGGPGNVWHGDDSFQMRNSNRIRVQNCSFANSDDEQIAIENASSSRAVFVDNVVAFALRSPIRGDHRFGPFVRTTNGKIGFYRNLMQGARRGYPRLANSNSTSWASNLCVSPKSGASSSPVVLEEKSENPSQTIFDFFGNEYIWSSTRLTSFRNTIGVETVLYASGNVIRNGFNGEAVANARENHSSISYTEHPTLAPGARLIDAAQISVRDFVFTHAGMRPNDRDETDELALTEIRNGDVVLRTQPVDNAPRTREGRFDPVLDWSRKDGRGRANVLVELDALHAALGGVTRWR